MKQYLIYQDRLLLVRVTSEIEPLGEKKQPSQCTNSNLVLARNVLLTQEHSYSEMEEPISFFGVKGLFYYKRSYGLGYDAAPSNESSLGISGHIQERPIFLHKHFCTQIGRYGGLSQPLQLDNQLYTIQRTFNKITPKRGNPVHKASSSKKGVKSESQARARRGKGYLD